ncbi:unnamed protein product [Mytilus edulis]|uniref:Endonuclease/exonuclease/phosphatase domain-containing protein n=1 Tax=Mytilus edulis TaxID=6550 RepID=A0A8S3TG96_MYTED|nr:unnamed protein product [Mytilus edulis]
MLNGFNLIDFYPHAIHLHRPHCGIFAYVKEGLQVDSIEFIEEEGIEGIQLIVSLSEKHYCLTSIYCHPSTNVDNICDTIHSVVTPNYYTVLLGDINIDQFKQTTQLKKLQSTMHALNLGQAHIDETTDNHSSIDHAYITRQQRFESGSLESYWSDHKILWFHIL